MNLTAADLVNISLALEDREIILRNSKGHHSANHLRFLRERLDQWMAENDIPHARLVVEESSAFPGD
jgi:hypothetical protein